MKKTHIQFSFYVRNILAVNLNMTKEKRINYYLATDKYVYESHQIFSKYGINKKDVLCWAKGIHQNILNVL